MSDKPISKGDLVQVVRAARCGCTHKLGCTFTVSGFRQHPTFICGSCNRRYANSAPGVLGYPGFEFDPYRLKRIPPLGELESEKRDEEIPA